MGAWVDRAAAARAVGRGPRGNRAADPAAREAGTAGRPVSREIPGKMGFFLAYKNLLSYTSYAAEENLYIRYPCGVSAVLGEVAADLGQNLEGLKTNFLC